MSTTANFVICWAKSPFKEKDKTNVKRRKIFFITRTPVIYLFVILNESTKWKLSQKPEASLSCLVIQENSPSTNLKLLTKSSLKGNCCKQQRILGPTLKYQASRLEKSLNKSSGSSLITEASKKPSKDIILGITGKRNSIVLFSKAFPRPAAVL